MPPICNHRQREEFLPKQAGGEDEHYQILDLTGVRVQPSHHLVTQLFRLLSFVGFDGVDVQDIRCPVVREGEVTGQVTGKLTRQEIKKGYVLACMSFVEADLVIDIPKETLAKETVLASEDADRFRYFEPELLYKTRYKPSPLVTKLYLELDKPTLENNQADHQRV